MSNRELTAVEKTIIRAIVADAGSKAVVEELLAIANEYVAESGLTAKVDETARIKAEEKADLEREAEVTRQAKADEVSQVIDTAPAKLPATPSALVVGLTVREVGMLVKIAESEYNDGDITGQTWADCICADRAEAGLVGNLAKKGMVACYGAGREKVVNLTPRGVDGYKAAKMLG